MSLCVCVCYIFLYMFMWPKYFIENHCTCCLLHLLATGTVVLSRRLRDSDICLALGFSQYQSGDTASLVTIYPEEDKYVGLLGTSHIMPYLFPTTQMPGSHELPEPRLWHRSKSQKNQWLTLRENPEKCKVYEEKPNPSTTIYPVVFVHQSPLLSYILAWCQP